MKAFVITTLLAVSLLTGCSSGDAATTGDNSGATTSGTTTIAEKATCGGCGSEVPKAELVAHDGTMLCKACMASHNH